MRDFDVVIGLVELVDKLLEIRLEIFAVLLCDLRKLRFRAFQRLVDEADEDLKTFPLAKRVMNGGQFRVVNFAIHRPELFLRRRQEGVLLLRLNLLLIKQRLHFIVAKFLTRLRNA